MNMKSIYSNPYKYACKCDIPFELAKIMCKKQRHFEKEQRKHPMHCPVCKSKNLIFESGSYEEGYGDFIECDDCGETFDCNEVPNVEYANLTGWENFDPVLYFANTENKSDGWMEACGATTHEEWVRFATKMIIGLRIVKGESDGMGGEKVVNLDDAIEIVKQGGASDDVCEWKSTSNGEFIQNPHTSRLFSNEPSMKNVHCNTCGKKIKVVD